MAVISGTQTSYGQVGIREQLADKIYMTSPTETPVMTAIGRGPAATNKKVEWQDDTLEDAGVNAQLDGADAVFSTATQTTRPCNYTQIFSKSVIVSGSAQAMDTAGRRQELLYQVDKRSKEIKRDIELAILSNTASNKGSDATARKLGGLESWIETNDDRGSGGAAGGYTTSTSQTVAATDASAGALRTFTEARCKAVIGSGWESSGADFPMIVVGKFNKEKASAFPGIAQPTQQYPASPKSSDNLAIVGAAKFYVSDFGWHKVVASRHVRTRSAIFLDPDFVDLSYLRPFSVEKLGKSGDAEKRQLLAELTMRVKDERKLGICADLLSS
jgi:hypothetical protein